MRHKHTFHIPVMGTAFTADTPLKVSQYGIDSVISIVDDVLLERLRKVYSDKYNMFYDEIKNNIKDYRAQRITSYLNLVHEIAEYKFHDLTSSVVERYEDIKKYFRLLPKGNQLREDFAKYTLSPIDFEKLTIWLKENLSMGSIDVNIMTKVDKKNYYKKKELSSEYNDAHAALRGYANSKLESSVIFSAGLNPSLYGYIAEFDDFFPNIEGYIKKKIVLKVSDYRSAIIQGKFLAKKGLWVSEYRIESGLNCGGHAFATDGYLLGPILAEFKTKRIELFDETYKIFKKALIEKNRIVPQNKLNIKITAQGGVGTAEEHDFLIKHYNLDSVGWGTPFLLVPEVTNVDKKTLNKLQKAKEKDLYLSKVSPLGVPFNNLRNSSKELEKLEKVSNGKPGSPCPRRYLALKNEYRVDGICTASRQYQKNKIKEHGISDKITDKVCLCMGLAATVVVNHKLDYKESKAISICPGPNMAYFDKQISLSEMTNFIYQGFNGIVREDRPNIFVKELNLYIDYLIEKVNDHKENWEKRSAKYLSSFSNNLVSGINYYQDLFTELNSNFYDIKEDIISDLKVSLNNLKDIQNEIFNLIDYHQQ